MYCLPNIKFILNDDDKKTQRKTTPLWVLFSPNDFFTTANVQFSFLFLKKISELIYMLLFLSENKKNLLKYKKWQPLA